MEKLADISIFNSLCRTTRVHNGWQTTPEKRESWLRMSRGGIMHALQMLSSSTIGYNQQQIARFIRSVMQEFYQENHNGHITGGESKDRQITGLIKRGGPGAFVPGDDGEAATVQELMDSVDRQFWFMESKLNRGIRTPEDKNNVTKSMRLVVDYISQLHEYHKTHDVPGIDEWYPNAVNRFTELRNRYIADRSVNQIH